MNTRSEKLVALILAAAPLCGLADVADLPRTNESVKVDGFLDESAWNDAVRVDLELETDPGENIPAPVATRAFLIEDGENLYVGFEADDPDPGAIRAFLRDRDSAWVDDHVGIILDTYNDERRAFEFYANPLGVQMDKTLDDTVLTNDWEIDDSWDGIWDSAGRITDTGYVVEIRIPLSQLRFPDIEGPKTWGYDLRRVYPRNRSHRLSSSARDRNRNCYLCQVAKLRGLEGSRPSRDIEIVPTLTAYYSETTEEPGIVPLGDGDVDVEPGLTMRWGITPDLTANLTINPDFSQVEADVAQLDVNNRFTLFFPEKRPFFLEGADYFSTPIDAVFTRTVAEPDVGAKLTGKTGDHTFGLFAAEDAVTNLLFPGLYGSNTTTLEQSNTAFVGRYSRGFADASSIGALVTIRDGEGYHNYVGGIDGRWRIGKRHRLTFQHLESNTDYPFDVALEFEQPTDEFDGSATRLGYDYESRNWTGELSYRDFSEGFRADAGFENKVGGRIYKGQLGHIVYGDDSSWWTRMRANLSFEQMDDEEGALAEQQTHLRLSIGGPMQSWVSLTLQDIRERDAGILYDMNRVRLYSEFIPRAGLEVNLVASYGDQIDYTNGRLGKSRVVEPNIKWNLSRNLLLRLQGVLSKLETPDGEKIFDATLADTRVTWQFNVRSFLRLTVQYQDVERNRDVYIEPTEAREKDIGRQLLYSYKLNPQTVFFLGYSDKYLDDDSLDGLTVEDRTWFMKIGYAWMP